MKMNWWGTEASRRMIAADMAYDELDDKIVEIKNSKGEGAAITHLQLIDFDKLVEDKYQQLFSKSNTSLRKLHSNHPHKPDKESR